MECDNPEPDSTRKLWTPWRMNYVKGNARESGCVFCNRLAASDDVESLILHRAEHSFVIMNLFPYNTGHVMLVPNRHAASPEDLDQETLSEMALLIPPFLRALRSALNCQGFNLGTNIGSIAGAGIAEHLHQHVVPRWTGDANFMPILASAMVMPEMIPVTYAKLRAEITRALYSLNTVTLVVFDPERDQVAVKTDGTLISIDLPAGVSVVNAALHGMSELGIETSLAGWAGSSLAVDEPSIALTLFSNSSIQSDISWRERAWIDPASDAGITVSRALHHLSPIWRETRQFS